MAKQWNGIGPWGTIREICEGWGGRDSFSMEHPGVVNWVMNCPICGLKDRLYVIVECPEEEEEKSCGDWICYHCWKSENEEWRTGRGLRGFVKLYCEFEGVDYVETMTEYNEWFAEGQNTFVDWGDLTRKKKPAPKVEKITGVIPCYKKGRDPAYRIPRYFLSRGVTKEQCRRFRLGFAATGPLEGRVVFPIEDPRDPAAMGYCARAVSKFKEPRYRNSAASSGMVFGWSQAKDAKTLVVVEGAFDALAVDRAGFPVVGVLGKSIHALAGKGFDADAEDDVTIEALTSALHDTETRRVIFMLDPSALGDSIMQIVHLKRFDWYVAGSLGSASDPGEATTRQITRAIETALPAEEAWEDYLLGQITRLLKDMS